MTSRSLIRLGVRCLVFVLFLGAVTFFVLVAYGYRYDRQDNRLEPTGIIAVDGNYREVQVQIDGKVIARNLPVAISGVREGFHRLAVVREGFLPWSKDVQVTNGIVTSVPFVILLPASITTAEKPILSTATLFSSPVELVGASDEGLLFKTATDVYSYVDLLTKKKTALLLPKNTENPIFDLVSKRAYGFHGSLLRTLKLDVGSKKITVSSEDAFAYSRDGLQFLQFSSDFKEFLFYRGGEIASILVDVPQSERLFTRLGETVKRLSWYYDTRHFVLQVANKLEFCDDSFSNCYVLRDLADTDSYAVTKQGIVLYESKQHQVTVIPLFNGGAFLSYIFSEQVSL